METLYNSSKPQTILTQTENNTTLWIGHLQNDPNDHFGGQTFSCPAEGILDNIQLYADAVSYPGEVNLSFHELNKNGQSWGPSIARSTLYVGQSDSQNWIRFTMPSIPLKKTALYGFRLQTDKAMVGLGEAAHDTNHPFSFGREWNGSSANELGDFYSYFSLAFKVEMRA
jgi:hypothetical protein